MITWKRPSGTLIETNDNPPTIEYALNAGWERQDAKPSTDELEGKDREWLEAYAIEHCDGMEFHHKKKEATLRKEIREYLANG